MKVLLVHNFYRSTAPSGEDAAYRNEKELLRSHGVEVVAYERCNDDIASGTNKLKSAFSTIWSSRSYNELKVLIAREQPDIAHFHNIWYLISPSAYHACKNAGVPVVQTFHNFRAFCVNGLLLRNGSICEACIGGVPFKGVFHGCYRDSRVYSLPVAMTDGIHRLAGTWLNKIDAYIALTGFGRDKIIECGLPAEKVFIKPNFVPDPPSPGNTTDDYILYAGRLSKEKGVADLVNGYEALQSACASPVRLRIIGGGELQDEISGAIRSRGIRNIDLAGRKNVREVIAALRSARFLVMPTRCYEMFPLTVIEAFACGRPVLGSRLGAVAEIVADHETGLLFEPGNVADLAEKMQWMIVHEDACREMGRKARREFEKKYTAEKNFGRLIEIYESVLARAV